MSRDRSLSADYQRAVGEMVEREVVYCVSMLIYALQKGYECWRAMELDESEMYGLAAQDDWETPGTYYIENDMDRDQLVEELEDRDVIDSDEEWGETEEELKALREKLIEDIDDWEEFCSDNRIDPEQHEVYEHWIVSGWLAGKLEEHGEVVVKDFLGLTIWGRGTTGQSIKLDGVICAIYDETHPEEVSDAKV